MTLAMTNQTQPKTNVHRSTPIQRISRGVDDRGDQQIYPYSFLRTRVDQWNFFLYLCLFSRYVMENQGWAYFTTLFTPVDPYREFRHTDPGFYQVLARVCEQRQTHDLDMTSTNIATIFIPSTVIFGC